MNNRTVKTERLVIAKDNELIKLQELQTRTKEQAKKEFFEYVGNYVKGLDVVEVNAFSSLFNAQCTLDPAITLDKRMELVGVELHKVIALFNRYNDIEVNKDDPNTYATTPEQITRFELANKFISMIHELQASSNNRTFLPLGIMQGVGGCITFNQYTNQYEPNTTYVLHG